MPSLLHYFDTLPKEFRRYFRRHVKKAITFYIEATLDDITEHVTLMINLGPYGRNGPDNITSDLNKLEECVKYVLNNYYLPTRKVKQLSGTPAFYYIPRVRREHPNKARMALSLYNALDDVARAYSPNGDINVATLKQIKDSVTKDGLTFHMSDLQRLIDSGCVREDMVGTVTCYSINES